MARPAWPRQPRRPCKHPSPQRDIMDVRGRTFVRPLDCPRANPLSTSDSLYETFPPSEAERLAEKLEIHDTPQAQAAVSSVSAVTKRQG